MIFWDRTSYIVQLLVSCLLFMAPVEKRKNYVLRVAAASAVLIGAFWVINGSIGIPTEGIAKLIYWITYLIISVGFVLFGIRCSFGEAVCCMICASATQHVASDLYLIYRVTGGKSPVAAVTIYALVYSLFYFAFAKRLPQNRKYVVSRHDLIPMATIILFVGILSVYEYPELDTGVKNLHDVIYEISDALCCIYVLWVQVSQSAKARLQKELDGVSLAYKIQRAQYQLNQENIDIINRKCHDLKHQIRRLRKTENLQEKNDYFDELEDAIMIYDMALNTGNKALDTVLMENGLYCKNHDIQWTCMADGTKLGFMKDEDIYALFGNAFDNAIAAVMQVSDNSKRVISSKMLTQDKVMVIQIQNYFVGNIRYEDGLPVTTKEEKEEHGFGMKSIRYTAEKYNGTITVNANNGIFVLQILLPLP